MITRTLVKIGVLEPSGRNKNVKIKRQQENGEFGPWEEKYFRSSTEFSQFSKLRRFIADPSTMILVESDGPTSNCKDKWCEK